MQLKKKLISFANLKKVKENESIVVYRLGRLKTPAYKPGYCILFPLIDEIKRHTTMPKEFFLPYLQVRFNFSII